MILENWNIKHSQKKKLGQAVHGTIKDAMIARIGNLPFHELHNLIIEGVECEELTENDRDFIE